MMATTDIVEGGVSGVLFPAGARVLVTGASGFIGGRLVERLLSLGAAEIRCPVRSPQSAARLAGPRVHAVAADLADAARMAELVSGADYLFHCAYDVEQPASNIPILRSLMAACTAASPRRFVLVSSFSVYQPFPDGLLTEQAADGDRTNPYVDVKLTLEQMVLEATRAGRLSGTVIQPAIVYGPRGGVWTSHAAQRLRTGEVVLPDEGEGLCNPVHVDDLVDSMLLAAVRPDAVGERFIITGPDTVTWATFHSELAREIGAPAPVLAPARTIIADLAAPPPRGAKRVVRRVLRAGRVRRLLERFPALRAPASLLARMAGLPPRERYLPEQAILQLYLAKATASTRKAERALGYRGRIPFAAGMRETGAWLRGEARP